MHRYNINLLPSFHTLMAWQTSRLLKDLSATNQDSRNNRILTTQSSLSIHWRLQQLTWDVADTLHPEQTSHARGWSPLTAGVRHCSSTLQLTQSHEWRTEHHYHRQQYSMKQHCQPYGSLHIHHVYVKETYWERLPITRETPAILYYIWLATVTESIP